MCWRFSQMSGTNDISILQFNEAITVSEEKTPEFLSEPSPEVAGKAPLCLFKLVEDARSENGRSWYYENHGQLTQLDLHHLLSLICEIVDGASQVKEQHQSTVQVLYGLAGMMIEAGVLKPSQEQMDALKKVSEPDVEDGPVPVTEEGGEGGESE